MIETEGIKYLGSKKKIIPYILGVIRPLGIQVVCDIFTGTTRVAQALKQENYSVITNDLATYSEVFAGCYLINDKNRPSLQAKMDHLNGLSGQVGWFSQHYAGGSTAKGKKYSIMFFQQHNTEKLDVIRDEIDKISTGIERDILLTSLILAMDRVDNTVGVQQAFLKNTWSTRSHQIMKMVIPQLITHKQQTYTRYREDANILAPKLKEVDLVYIDPPYTNHSYYHYYHIWETIIRNDKPQVYGVPNKRVDAQQSHSKYNYKAEVAKAFEDLLTNLKVPYLLISYNDEGILLPDDMEKILAKQGEVSITEIDYKRNVMCDIGRYNDEGVRVSKKQKDKNVEFLYLVKKK
jgi:adenine-specific DNA-methyltransferase